jgi:hypothetical protein
MGKKYWTMTTRELREESERFDQPMVVDRSRPLTPEERKQWRRIKRKRGRPRVGQGFQRISVSLERALLRQATALARKRRISRSRLIAQAIEQVLAVQRASA